jgi:hypothetical protein
MTKQQLAETLEELYIEISGHGAFGRHNAHGLFIHQDCDGTETECVIELGIYERELADYDSYLEEMGIEYQEGISYINGLVFLKFYIV